MEDIPLICLAPVESLRMLLWSPHATLHLRIYRGKNSTGQTPLNYPRGLLLREFHRVNLSCRLVRWGRWERYERCGSCLMATPHLFKPLIQGHQLSIQAPCEPEIACVINSESIPLCEEHDLNMIDFYRFYSQAPQHLKCLEDVLSLIRISFQFLETDTGYLEEQQLRSSQAAPTQTPRNVRAFGLAEK